MSILKQTSFQILSASMAGQSEHTFKVAHRAEFNHVERRPGYLYVRSRAISSRINENFDGFDAEEITKGYQTFMGKPVFVSHHNSNHRRARGAIVAVALHEDHLATGEPDTWVEVLMEVDGQFKKLCQAIIAGEIARTSMGCDVAYSSCTFCGNKAYTEAEYCKHIPRLKGKRIRRVDAKTGASSMVLVAEQCFGLNFFENSLLVEEPADPTAFVLGIDGLGVTAAPHFAIDDSLLQQAAEVDMTPSEAENWADEFGEQSLRELIEDEHAERQARGTTFTEPPGTFSYGSLFPRGFILTADDNDDSCRCGHASSKHHGGEEGADETCEGSMDASEDGPRHCQCDGFVSASEYEGGTISFKMASDALPELKMPPPPYRVDCRNCGNRSVTNRNHPKCEECGDLHVIPVRHASFGGKRIASLTKRAAANQCIRYSSHEVGPNDLTCPECEEIGFYDTPTTEMPDVQYLKWLGKQSSKTAINETIAPPEVDTLRASECPICGSDAYNGEECPVCMFIKPPDMFMDPDLEAAQNADLRQNEDQAQLVGGEQAGNDQLNGQTPVGDDLAAASQEGDLQCDSCGAVQPGQASAGTDPAVNGAPAPGGAPTTQPTSQPPTQPGAEPPPPVNDCLLYT